MTPFQAVIFDRDGVINADSDAFVRSVDDWQPLPGAIEAIARLHRAGLATGVATNQSGLARGLVTSADLDAIHQCLRTRVEMAGGRVASIRWCPHGPHDGCACRKPQPGLLHRVAADLGVSVAQSIFIGDSLRDMQAAMRAGMTPLLVRTGNGRRDEAHAREIGVRLLFDDLADAADALLAAWR